MTVTRAKELGDTASDCAIAPGFVGTGMVLSMTTCSRKSRQESSPTLRLPDEIAQGVQFIPENDYFSGRVLDIDGALRI